MSEEDLLDLFLIIKNATIAPTTRIDITIPATPPPPIPDFLLPGLLLFSLDLWSLLGLFAGGVPGGGGGAGPEIHELPFDLLWKIHESL